MAFPVDAGLLKHLISNGKHPPPPSDVQFIQTSVFMLVFNRQQIPCLLAVLKANNTGYPWRNQVALPGGHVDEADKDALAAAYREVEEEVHIPPDKIELMGSIGHFQTVQQKDIEVFLGLWHGLEDEVQFDPSEISRVLTPSIPMLLNRHLDQNFAGRTPGIGELVYPIENAVIWGVTARIIHYFLELVRTRLSEEKLQALIA